MSNFISNISLAGIKNSLDEVRAQVYPRNETERKVYEALSSKNWGASSTLLNDIAAETMDYEKYNIVSSIIWSNLEAEGKSWKHIFKTLTLIEFLIKNGSERIIESSRDKLYKIRTFQDYNYYEGTVDKGSGVREKAKQLVELLGSNEMIRQEREKARALRNKFVGIDSRNAGGGYGGYDTGNYGGSGSNYSTNSTQNRSNGRYGNDTYGESNGRYGGDSYNNTGRYGGGAYDSDRPPRYGDEQSPSQEHDTETAFHDNKFNGGSESFINNSNDETGDFEPPALKSVKSAKPKTSNSTQGTGKLGKIVIKKPVNSSGNPTTTPSKSVQPEINLFEVGEPDLLSAPLSLPTAPTPATNNQNDFLNAFSSPGPSTFDPFASSPAPAAFDPFSNTPVKSSNTFSASSNTFDPFASQTIAPQANNNANFMNSAPQQPGLTANYSAAGMGFPMAQNYNQPTNQLGFSNTQSLQMQNNFVPASQPNLPLANTYQPSLASSSGNANDTDFGDFSTASAQTKPAVPKPVDKWADVGKLVDLSGIGKNDEIAKQKASAASQSYTQNSFAGLDGFSKTQQSMSQGPRPSLNQAIPPQNPMMTRSMNVMQPNNQTFMGGQMGMNAGGFNPGNSMAGGGMVYGGGGMPMAGGMPMGGGGMGMGGMGMGGMGMGGMGMGAPPGPNMMLGQPPMNGNANMYPNPGMMNQGQQFQPSMMGGNMMYNQHGYK